MAEARRMAESRRRRMKWSNVYSFSCLRHSHVDQEASSLMDREGFSRVVQINRPNEHYVPYASNWVSTTKYNLLTFFPKALFEQFRRVANIYFLFAAALSLTPLSPFTASSLIAPLVFVIGVSMAKEGIEDWNRFLQDKEVNNRKVLVHEGGGTFAQTEWKKVRVGDLVKIEKDSFFPADLLLLSSSFEDGICYVETMNLDGETNLKLKRSLEYTMDLDGDDDFDLFQAKVICEDPNPHLYSFIGKLEIVDHEEPLGPQQILLRDSMLRNTEYIYGAVIFSGHDTKVMQNATPPPSKRSSIEKRMDIIIYILFFVLFLMSLLGSVVLGIFTYKLGPNWWYMKPYESNAYYSPNEPVVAALAHLVTALVLYGYLIPISLYVSIEIVKVAQAMFINQDLEMYHEETDTPACARTSNLNEELGQVDTILSDKTGTLTCNQMEFVKCSIAGVSYGQGLTEVEIAAAQRQGESLTLKEDIDCIASSDVMVGEGSAPEKSHVKGFNFKDERLMDNCWIQEKNVSDIQLFFRILSICHTAIPEEDEETGQTRYEAESPDEGAFVVTARELGFEFCKRTQSSVLVKEYDLASGERVTREYKLLELLEFSSARKRMSVVVKDEEDNILLFCKGADSVIFERLGKDGKEHEELTRAHLAHYADAGLRTLVLAYRKLDSSEYESWSDEFLKARTYVGADRDTKLDEVAELIERNLILVGSTAVEDKLQRGVPQCIDKLAQAGIKIWVLTGDKLETAVNIGFACSLLRQGMTQMIVSLDKDDVKAAEASGDKDLISKVSQESTRQQIMSARQQLQEEEDVDSAFALIIDGKALNFALGKDFEGDLMQLAIKCSSVICCRVSPKQKAMITKLVKESTGTITLGIGDGANDVGMIQEAHVGVGISGVEGMQATMASDFSVAQFCYLERLLLVHGSWCYKRIAFMVCYFFYKNILFGFTIFYYEAYAAFSGQAAYNDWYMSLFNVFFTSLPVIALGVLEQDVVAQLKLQFPHLYQQGIKNLHFGWIRILGWMGSGIASSLIVFYFTVNILKYQAFRKGGQVSSLDVLGATLYTCVVWTVNCQLVIFTKHFTWVQHFCIWGSILLWYIFLIAYGFLSPTISTTAYKIFIEACAPSPSYWLIILLVSTAALLPSFVYKAFQNTFDPIDDQIIQEFSHQKKHKDSNWLKRVMENKTFQVNVGVTAKALQKDHRHDKKGSREPKSKRVGSTGKVSPVTADQLEP
eukprot:c22146_g2_i1 orf=517-4191(-)